MSSPYDGVPVTGWTATTRTLIAQHPLDTAIIYEVAYTAWEAIATSRIGRFQIGVDIYPKPQILGFLLHELIALDTTHRYPSTWRRDQTITDKDLVYIPNAHFSIEIKTSSSRRHIFGNRSYTQHSTRTQKAKSGYYLAINFDQLTPNTPYPPLRLVRFGWLDYTDWQGQSSATGQQARLNPAAEQFKLLALPLIE